MVHPEKVVLVQVMITDPYITMQKVGPGLLVSDWVILHIFIHK